MPLTHFFAIAMVSSSLDHSHDHSLFINTIYTEKMGTHGYFWYIQLLTLVKHQDNTYNSCVWKLRKPGFYEHGSSHIDIKKWSHKILINTGIICNSPSIGTCIWMLQHNRMCDVTQIKRLRLADLFNCFIDIYYFNARISFSLDMRLQYPIVTLIFSIWGAKWIEAGLTFNITRMRVLTCQLLRCFL